jgi:hypothetical protein
MVGIKHSLVTAKPNDPTYDVSATNWNAEHTIDNASIPLAKLANGGYVLEPTYTIYKSGATYYAMDGNGAIPFQGADAFTVIQAALNTCVGGETIIVKNDVTLSGDLAINCPLSFDAENVNIYYGGVGTAITWTPNSSVTGGELKVQVTAVGAAVNSATATAVRLVGVNGSTMKIVASEFKAGTAIGWVSSTTPVIQNEINTFYLWTRNCKIGIALIGDGSWSYNHFISLAFSCGTITNSICIDASNNTLAARNWLIDELYYWIGGQQVAYCINGNMLTVSTITKMTVEALPTGGLFINGNNLTVFNNCSYSLTVKNYHEAGCATGYLLRNAGRAVWEPIVNAIHENYGLTWTTDETELLMSLMCLGKFKHVAALGDYANLHSGGGGAWSSWFEQTCATGAAAGAVSCVHSPLHISANTNFLWDKTFAVYFGYMRSAGASAQSVARVKVAPAAAGALSGHGLGIRVDNTALYGISYGTGGVEVAVNLNTALVDGVPYQISIYFYVGRIEWYVDGVLRGTQSTAANIPSASASCSMIHEITNGADNVNYQSHIISPSVWSHY